MIVNYRLNCNYKSVQQKEVNYFIKAIELYGDMHAKYQDFSMYRCLQIIYVSVGFLEFYTNYYCKNNRMTKFIG
jgi:hypothetical protein